MAIARWIFSAVILSGCQGALQGGPILDGRIGDAATDADVFTVADAPEDSVALADAASRACTPGATRSCACYSGTGVSRCDVRGAGFGMCVCSDPGVEIFVDANAVGEGNGNASAPFATLQAARDQLRQRLASGSVPGDATIWLRGGTHTLRETLSFSAGEQLLANARLHLRGVPGEDARIVGGQILAATCFQPLPETDELYPRLPVAMRSRVRVCDLRTQGVTDFGEHMRREGESAEQGVAPLEFFAEGIPTELARWPDRDQHEAPPDPNGAEVQIAGNLTPNVAGRYLRFSSSDGVSAFRRDGLVDGVQYYFYRHSGPNNGGYTAWFLTATTQGYPETGHPFWYRYNSNLAHAQLEPAQGAVGIAEVDRRDRISHGFLRTGAVSGDRTFSVLSDRPWRWGPSPDIRVHGMFFYEWADTLDAVELNPTARTARLQTVPGYGLRADQEYYFYNVPDELNRVGEYYVDRIRGLLVVVPDDNFLARRLIVSLVDRPMVEIQDFASLEVADLSIGVARGDLVHVSNSHRIAFENVRFHDAGANATIVRDSHDVRFSGCTVVDIGTGGIKLGGGNRRSLTASGNEVSQSSFNRVGRLVWAYQEAIELSGVGATVRNNDFTDLPHSAIWFQGNDHQIERNRIQAVCKTTSDAGAIYAGRDWGLRGNVIRHNVFANIATEVDGLGIAAVYLDDVASGVEVHGNIFFGIRGSAILHGGGRDDLMHHNIIVDAENGLQTDARGHDLANLRSRPGWDLLARLVEVGYQESPWSQRYPACAAIPSSWAQILASAARWRYPEGSTWVGNWTWNVARPIWAVPWETGNPASEPLQYFSLRQDNQENLDPGLERTVQGGFQLASTSPLHALPQFVAIPFASIGASR